MLALPVPPEPAFAKCLCPSAPGCSSSSSLCLCQLLWGNWSSFWSVFMSPDPFLLAPPFFSSVTSPASKQLVLVAVVQGETGKEEWKQGGELGLCCVKAVTCSGTEWLQLARLLTGKFSFKGGIGRGALSHYSRHRANQHTSEESHASCLGTSDMAQAGESAGPGAEWKQFLLKIFPTQKTEFSFCCYSKCCVVLETGII